MPHPGARMHPADAHAADMHADMYAAADMHAAFDARGAAADMHAAAFDARAADMHAAHMTNAVDRHAAHMANAHVAAVDARGFAAAAGALSSHIFSHMASLPTHG